MDLVLISNLAHYRFVELLEIKKEDINNQLLTSQWKIPEFLENVLNLCNTS